MLPILSMRSEENGRKVSTIFGNELLQQVEMELAPTSIKSGAT